MKQMRLLLSRAATIAALFLAFAFSSAWASVDVSPADGIPDIWALLYNSGGLSPAADSDGDGQKNSAEAAAGTNPLQAGSVIKITSVTADAGGVHLTFPTVQGKRYQIQTAATLINPTWADLGNPLTPDGTVTLTATNNAAGATGLFYRVRVQDIDSDNDGISDWEEMQIGYDPYNAHSHGLASPADLAALTTALSATNVITVSSSGAPVTEPAAANTSTEAGTITLQRSGNLNALTVSYTVSGSATPNSDYAAVSGTVSFGLGATTATVTIVPLPDALLESPESVVVTASAGAGYTVGTPAVAAVLINDYAQANGTGLTAKFWEEGSTTLSQTVLPTLTGTAINGGVYAGLNQTTASWGTTNANGTRPAGLGTDLNWSSRWTGEVLPQYSQLYTFSLETNFAGRLYVNGRLVVNNWPPISVQKSSSDDAGTPTTTRAYGDIELTGGVRAAVVVEHYQDGGTGRCYLRWESANQAEEFIPATRLFPTAPPQITSALSVLRLKDSPLYTYQILASSTPTSYGAANLPPGWTINTTTGVISGLPTQVGTWAVPLTATNALGSGSAILTINVIATDGGITRDLWTGVAGSAVSDIPLTTTPASSSVLTLLEVPQTSPDVDNFGDRIRGYITAPTTGTYKFWLTGDDAAELWVSDDDEPVNAFKRAALTSAVGYRNWAAGGVSPLLYLEAGSRYYVEVRRKEGTGTDHVSVGWLKPGDPGTLASEVVPGYALSRYVTPALVPGESNLYATSMTAQSGAVTSGYGSSTLRLSADETVATLRFSFANLTTNLAASGRHIHLGNHGGAIVYDIDTATPNSDGTYTWVITTVGAYTRQIILDEIHGGTAYINIHTATYPAGEIRGFYSLQAASQTFTAPVAPPAWTDDHTDPNAASRFLIQSTFGPTSADIASLVVPANSYDAWIESQFLVPATHHLDFVIANRNTTNPDGPTYYTDLTTNSWWKNSILAPDQLRQRVAFALSEILVLSTAGPLEDNARAVSAFYDKLLDDAFGNFRAILEDVTLTPGMGIYLDMRRNDKPNLVTGAHPNENYAREIKQLFSIGLNRVHPDGSLVLNSKGELIPTYGQDEIIGFAHAFTGWDYHQNMSAGLFPTGFAGAADYINPMTEIPEHHYTGQKRLLNRVVLPGLTSVAGVALDPYADHTKAPYSRTLTINDPTYQNLPAQELDATHDALFNHPNCPPFICRQLIQRLVTSTPSPGYVYRVGLKFQDNGFGVRGDMKAVIKAILLDYEARSPAVLAQQGHGKQREPVLRVTAVARAFAPPAPVSGNYVQDGGVITVDTTPTAHRLVSGNPVALTFTGTAPQATSGNYSLSGTFPITTTSFPVRAQDAIRSTYTQSGTTVRVVTGSGVAGSVDHGLVTGDYVYLRFRDGTGKPADGVFQVTVGATAADKKVFTVTVPTTATIATAANCDAAYLRGAYSQRLTTVTLTTGTIHGLTTGANVSITFVGKIGAASLPAVGTYPITVVDDTHFTYTAVDSASRDGTFNAAADVMVLNRSGTATTAFSNWTMGDSDTDIAQTPMRSPTVFNYFLPDYQFPGVTANAGLITPEFQLTSETNVVRNSNFHYNGIFNPSGNSSGFSSYRGGGGDIGLDFSPWMGIKPGGTTPWTDNANLNALIDQLNTLLMGGLLPSTGTNNYTTNPRTIVNAKQAIYDYVSNTSNIGYTNGAATDPQKMARIRAVIHLIVTSPDFTIQK